MPTDNQIAATKAALRHMMEAAGISDLTELARRAGVAHSTLTRVMSLPEEDLTWKLSASTWMKLSEATSVPITFLGNRIVVEQPKPGDGDIAAQRRRARLLAWWDSLAPEEQDHFFALMTGWAKRMSGAAEVG